MSNNPEDEKSARAGPEAEAEMDRDITVAVSTTTAAGIVVKLPPVVRQYEYGANPPPLCWQCPCGYLCFGGCCGEDRLPFKARLIHCISLNMSWCTGMYYGGSANQEKLEKMFAGGNAKAGEDKINGVKSWDVFVPSSLDPKTKIRARIFCPMTATRPPVMVYFHGGGWCLAHPDTPPFHNMATQFAKGGFLVVSVDYRLAPTHRFPAAVHDCYDVCKWVASKPVRDEPVFENLDVSRLILAGDSAGGNLAMVMATLVRDGLGPDLKPDNNVGFSVQQLLLIYPWFLMERFVKEKFPSSLPFLPTTMIDFYFDSYVPGASIEEKRKTVETERRLSPVLAGFHGLPRTLMVIAERDLLRFENHLSVDLMKQSGVEVVSRAYPGQPHGFLSIDKYKPADICIQNIVNDLKDGLANQLNTV